MPYKVVQEFVLQRGAEVLHVSEVGSTVQLSAAEATDLLAAGKVSHPDSVGDPGKVAAWLSAEQQYLEDVEVWLEAEKRHAAKPRRTS
ncbi:hypothetical protein [Mycolicibacterium palauense]|uniref:hypothetical protein n=1 Tax=Mycolicibacterium palauense TaxID=2034511 RepID=UPI000BFED571|nr:hypothetical protein [Mycolicibacterium palauense]